MKKIGTNKKAWNVYKNEKYGFEFSAPKKYEIYDVGVDERYGIFFSFKAQKDADNFVVHIKQAQKPVFVSDKKDFIAWKCGNTANKIQKCNKIIRNYTQLKDYLIISTIEGAGVNENVAFYYIFNTLKPSNNVYFFTSNSLKNEYLDIVKTLKIKDNYDRESVISKSISIVDLPPSAPKGFH